MNRLIDGCALWQQVFFHTYPVQILDNEKKVLDEVLNIIDNAPTVEPEKGVWLYNYHTKRYRTCSNCGFTFSAQKIQRNSKYCQMCGARMEDQDET